VDKCKPLEGGGGVHIMQKTKKGKTGKAAAVEAGAGSSGGGIGGDSGGGGGGDEGGGDGTFDFGSV
jgi:hypothetical protein